jgi:hypothetical protein
VGRPSGEGPEGEARGTRKGERPMSILEEAPYKFIYDEVIVDGKKVKVFRLTKFGKELVEKIPILATDSRVTYILERLIDLENFVKSEMLPFFKDNLLAFIAEHPDVDTKTLHAYLFDKSSVRQSIRFEALETLKHEGKIESTTVGRGKPRKWRIKKKAKQ